MFKTLSAIALLLIAAPLWSQTTKPITQMVQQAQLNATFQSVSLFASGTTEARNNPATTDALQSGLLLQWDETKAQAVRQQAGQPLTLTLPWQNGQTIQVDLVPARNFSSEFEAQAASGRKEQLDYGIHYWGIIKDQPNSLVTISLFDHEIMGMIATEDAHYNLGPLKDDPTHTHVLYDSRDLRQASQFDCHTDESLHRIGEEAMGENRSVGPDNCVRMYVEADYTLFQNKGSVANVTSYVTGVFSQVSALYTNESINLVLHFLKVWDVNDPYNGPSANNYLTQFRTALNGVFNGDLAHLIGIHNLGGVAYLDVLCYPSYGVGYSSINATYSNVPTYSWTIEVITHEIGHNLGSEHTHACAWNGNNTAIDGCGPAAGYSEGCNAAVPTQGTIMSYCHLVSGVGINFNLGFGTQPGDRIRSKVYNAPCLNVCGGGGGPCTYNTINTNNFEAGFGIWTDGGTDCARINNTTYANSPTYSIQLRDNTNTSVMTTTNQNYAAYEELTVDFSYITVSFETGEDFWVQVSTNGGTSYTTIGDFNAGTQFTNGVRASGSVVIPGPFTSTTRIRFRADASADDDQVYIDDVVIRGCSQAFQNGGGDREAMSNHTATHAGISEFKTTPNPAQDLFQIQFDTDTALEAQLIITDLTGRTASQQRIQANEGHNRIQVPVQDLGEGLYYVTLRAGDQILTEKLIISRR
jgi:Metallo-peptidase family M12/Secretion system C-terminal sorting domain/Reprolysin family propeptide